MAGSAVATIVWSATAKNIGSMIEGKTVQNTARGWGGWPVPATPAAAGASLRTLAESSFIEMMRLKGFLLKGLGERFHGRQGAASKSGGIPGAQVRGRAETARRIGPSGLEVMTAKRGCYVAVP